MPGIEILSTLQRRTAEENHFPEENLGSGCAPALTLVAVVQVHITLLELRDKGGLPGRVQSRANGTMSGVQPGALCLLGGLPATSSAAQIRLALKEGKVEQQCKDTLHQTIKFGTAPVPAERSPWPSQDKLC